MDNRSALERVLSSYQHLGNQAYYTAYNLTTDDAHSYLSWFLLDMSVVPTLIAYHTLYAALKVYSMTPPNTAWLKSLILTMFAAFGGSTLAALLSARPAPLFTISSNVMMIYLFGAWYLIHQSRLIRSILSLRPVMAILAFGATAAKARAIFGFMDDFMRDFPKAVCGAIVLGGLAGSGGQLFVSLERIVQNGMQTPSEFSSPGWGFKSAYFAAAAYYIAVDPEGILYEHGISLFETDRSTARLYISSALCIHAALETLYGAHVNPLFWIEDIFFAITGLRDGVKPESETQYSQMSSEYAGRPTRHGSETESRPTGTGLRKRR